MFTAPLAVAVAAGVTGAAVLVLSVPRPAPAPSLTASGAAVRQDLGRRSGSGVVPVAPVAPAAPVPPVAPAASVSRFRWPLAPPPQVLRRFAVGPQPWSPGHRGVDLAAAAGQPVLAAGAGTVSFAGVVAGRGVVAVTHPSGIRTTYEPVTAAVRAGQVVSAGSPLGLLAAGSHCAATCLHWGALRGEVYLDPLTLLRPPEPPILLPMGRDDPVGRGAVS